MLSSTKHRPSAVLHLDQYRHHIRYTGVHQLMQLRPGHPFCLPLLICVQKQAAAAVRLHALITTQTVSLLVTGKARTQVANTHKFCFHPSTVPDKPGRQHAPGALSCSKTCTQALRGRPRPRYLGAFVNSLFLAAGQERLNRRAAVCVALADTCLTAPARTTPAPRRKIGERKEQQRDPACECAFKGGEPRLFEGVHRAVQTIAIKLIEHCAASQGLSCSCLFVTAGRYCHGRTGRGVILCASKSTAWQGQCSCAVTFPQQSRACAADEETCTSRRLLKSNIQFLEAALAVYQCTGSSMFSGCCSNTRQNHVLVAADLEQTLA